MYWFDISTHHTTAIMVTLVAICHHTGLWEYYRVYSLYYTIHPMTYSFYSWKTCLKRVPGETRSFKAQKCQNGFNASFTIKLYKVILRPHFFLVLYKEEQKNLLSSHNNWNVIYILLYYPKRRPGVNYIYNIEPNFLKVSFFPALFYVFQIQLLTKSFSNPPPSPQDLSQQALCLHPFCILLSFLYFPLSANSSAFSSKNPSCLFQAFPDFPLAACPVNTTKGLDWFTRTVQASSGERESYVNISIIFCFLYNNNFFSTNYRFTQFTRQKDFGITYKIYTKDEV